MPYISSCGGDGESLKHFEFLFQFFFKSCEKLTSFLVFGGSLSKIVSVGR